MIIGIGVDVVDMRRIERVLARYPVRFLTRCYTKAERDFYATLYGKASDPAVSLSFLAKRFAAKEAVLKALGTGLTQGLSWLDIELLPSPEGLAYRDTAGFAKIRTSLLGESIAKGGFQRYAPSLHLCGRALECLEALTPQGHQAKTHVSLTDEPPYASAFVVLEAVHNQSS